LVRGSWGISVQENHIFRQVWVGAPAGEFFDALSELRKIFLSRTTFESTALTCLWLESGGTPVKFELDKGNLAYSSQYKIDVVTFNKLVDAAMSI